MHEDARDYAIEYITDKMAELVNLHDTGVLSSVDLAHGLLYHESLMEQLDTTGGINAQSQH